MLMQIDLNFNDSYKLNEIVNIPKIYFESSSVKKLDNIKVEGKLYYDPEDNLYADVVISGNMVLADDISLEEVLYPFSIEYNDILDENLKNNQNTLDLFEFLWENIVLEVPLKFTKVTNLSEFLGDGWKFVSEEENSHEHNPFSELLENFDKKE